MNPEPGSRVTQLLVEWSAGDQAALTELLPLVYDELRRLAQRHLRHERPNHTLQRTALVHEAFLRLVNQKQVQWQSRAQFLGLASQLMRRILVDHARARAALKRGAGVQAVSLNETAAVFGMDQLRGIDGAPEALAVAAESQVDLDAIDQALTRLEGMDAQQSKVVELRFFGGLTIEETAQVIGISDATVKREWALARAWLRRELTPERAP